MNILVFNCGSSSIKYLLCQMPQQKIIARGMIGRIGHENATFKHVAGNQTVERQSKIETHQDAVSLIWEMIRGQTSESVDHTSRINAVCHRVVHGGSDFDGPVRIDESVIDSIERLIPLAPLHNPPDLAGIKAAGQLLPDVIQVACFDTAFHRTMPESAYLYGLPYQWCAEYGIRKYGFHGISHRYVADKAAQWLGRKLQDMNLITCHLGNGCSMTAIQNGRSVDTSMGFTPLEGLMMGTRPGDFDPAVIFYLQKKGFQPEQLNDMCNKQSGLLGVSGISNDIRDILQAAEQGHERAKLAIDIFCYRIKKYIGAYMAVLGRLDTVVFTGGIGEHCPLIRAQICEGLEPMGIDLDRGRNTDALNPHADIISTDQSKIKVMVIATDEEKAMAIDCFILLK